MINDKNLAIKKNNNIIYLYIYFESFYQVLLYNVFFKPLCVVLIQFTVFINKYLEKIIKQKNIYFFKLKNTFQILK